MLLYYLSNFCKDLFTQMNLVCELFVRNLELLCLLFQVPFLLSWLKVSFRGGQPTSQQPDTITDSKQGLVRKRHVEL